MNMIYLGAVHPSNTIDIIDSVNQQCVQLYVGIIASVSLGLQHICTSPHKIKKGDLIILSLIYVKPVAPPLQRLSKSPTIY